MITDHTRIIVMDAQSPANHMICKALQHSYPQADIQRTGRCADMVAQLSARNVMAVVMDWHTSCQPWQHNRSVAEYIRESHPDLMLVIVDGQTKVIAPSQAVHLTPRENDVIGYLRYGASNKDIADQMGLQVITVKLHVRNLCRKVGVKNRTQLALWGNDIL